MIKHHQVQLMVFGRPAAFIQESYTLNALGENINEWRPKNDDDGSVLFIYLLLLYPGLNLFTEIKKRTPSSTDDAEKTLGWLSQEETIFLSSMRASLSKCF